MATLKVVAFVVLVCMAVAGAPMVQSTMPCKRVISFLKPCITFLEDGEATPPHECCVGLQALVAAVNTTAGRVGVCICMKVAANSMSKFNPSNGQMLPGECGVKLPFTFGRNANCSAVN